MLHLILWVFWSLELLTDQHAVLSLSASPAFVMFALDDAVSISVTLLLSVTLKSIVITLVVPAFGVSVGASTQTICGALLPTVVDTEKVSVVAPDVSITKGVVIAIIVAKKMKRLRVSFFILYTVPFFY